MILYLCRHGIAEDVSKEGDDSRRALTVEGVKKFRFAAKGFLKLGADVTHILTSPLTRARQTAEILAEQCAQVKMRVDLGICESLGIPADLKKFLSRLKECGEGVVAVGHEPTLSEWVGELCFGGAGRCEMKKGAIAAIEMSGTRGKLLWILQPGQLRKMR